MHKPLTRAALLRQIAQCRKTVAALKRRYPHAAKWAELKGEPNA